MHTGFGSSSSSSDSFFALVARFFLAGFASSNAPSSSPDSSLARARFFGADLQMLESAMLDQLSDLSTIQRPIILETLRSG
jgi:hypothetical protein